MKQKQTHKEQTIVGRRSGKGEERGRGGRGGGERGREEGRRTIGEGSIGEFWD